MGPQFGVQDRETPISRGWIVSTGFEMDGQDYVVEGSWHRARSTDERYFGGDRFWEKIGLEQHSGRILTLAAGVRSRDQEGVIAPFYHVLLGGIQAVWRTDYEYPPTPSMSMPRTPDAEATPTACRCRRASTSRTPSTVNSASRAS